MLGMIKFIDVAGRHGFIARKGIRGPDVYFRADDLAAGLVFSRKLMQRIVEFDLKITGTSVRAINVHVRIADDDPGRATVSPAMGTDDRGNHGGVPGDSSGLVAGGGS